MKKIIFVSLVFIASPAMAMKVVYDLNTGEVVEVGYGDVSRFDPAVYGVKEVLDTDIPKEPLRHIEFSGGTVNRKKQTDIDAIEAQRATELAVQNKVQQAILDAAIQSVSLTATPAEQAVLDKIK